MPRSSLLHRKRTAHTQEDRQPQPFFSKKYDINKTNQEGAFFQAKLAINAPGDQYEKEANIIADNVVNKNTETPVLQQQNITSVQQKSPDNEQAEMNEVQKKENPFNQEEKNKKEIPVQTKQEGPSATTSSQAASKIQSSSGKGNTLPAKTLREMSSSFGADFSEVYVHHDSEAADMNKELNAQAFTYGNDIYFNEGKFNPENKEGKSLLAHELTHVIQQNKGDKAASSMVNRKININSKTSKIESVEFKVGAEISEAFCNLVQAELKKGRLDDKKVETFLLHLIKQNGTVSDSDKIFIAAII